MTFKRRLQYLLPWLLHVCILLKDKRTIESKAKASKLQYSIPSLIEYADSQDKLHKLIEQAKHRKTVINLQTHRLWIKKQKERTNA